MRERIGFWVSLLSLITGVTVILGAVTGKLGLLVVGPPELIAQVARADSLRSKRTDSTIAARVAAADSVHARLDSVNTAQDARDASFERKVDMLIALGCVNYPVRDRISSRLELACNSTLDRWRTPGNGNGGSNR